jgi:hemin uptake protein HemP
MFRECQVSEGRETSIERPEETGNMPAALRTVRSEDLLQGGKEVLIQHGQEMYRLRLTKAGKLILNK